MAIKRGRPAKLECTCRNTFLVDSLALRFASGCVAFLWVLHRGRVPLLCFTSGAFRATPKSAHSDGCGNLRTVPGSGGRTEGKQKEGALGIQLTGSTRRCAKLLSGRCDSAASGVRAAATCAGVDQSNTLISVVLKLIIRKLQRTVAESRAQRSGETQRMWSHHTKSMARCPRKTGRTRAVERYADRREIASRRAYPQRKRTMLSRSLRPGGGETIPLDRSLGRFGVRWRYVSHENGGSAG